MFKNLVKGMTGYGSVAASMFSRNPTAYGAAAGAAAGGLYGAMSDNTSVIGGMMMGAGMGAVGGRYGTSAIRRGRLGARGIGVGGTSTVTGARGFLAGAGRGIANRARMDYRGARLSANSAFNGIKSSLKR